MGKYTLKLIRITAFAGFILAAFLFQNSALAGNGDGPQDGKIVNFFSTDVKPALIKKPKIVYPELAMKAGAEGTVIVTLIIDEEGKIDSVRILKSVKMLDNAALEAAKKCFLNREKSIINR